MKGKISRCTNGIGVAGTAARFALVAAVLVLFTAPLMASDPVGVPCSYYGQNCTASDLDVLFIGVVASDQAEADITCTDVEDSVDVKVTQNLYSSPWRYDVGVGVDVSGGAGTECLGQGLGSGDITGTGTVGNQDGDTCDDMMGNVTYNGYYRIPCTDANMDCLVDAINVFTVWDNNQNTACSDPDTDPFAGTPAKCYADVSPVPGIVVTGTCGNDMIECTAPGDPPTVEECDNGEANDDHASCTSECMNAYCGDGLLWNTDGGTEECDNGEANSDTGLCTTNCTEHVCGDGFVFAGSEDPPLDPEECDLGAQNGDNSDCNANCVANYCGDGLVNTVGPDHIEQCDNGELNGTEDNPCSSECTLIAPTMPEWGLGFLALLLGGTGAAILRRKFRLS